MSVDPDKGSDFLFPVVSGSVMGHNKPPLQWEFGASLQRESSHGMKMTSHLYLIPKIK
jgi:hypothetical protein